MSAFNYGQLIVCAAIKYDDGKILIGVRHADCHKVRWDDSEVHGFLDNKGKFLNRKEAYKVAEKAGQIRYTPKFYLNGCKSDNREPHLFSENLY